MSRHERDSRLVIDHATRASCHEVVKDVFPKHSLMIVRVMVGCEIEQCLLHVAEEHSVGIGRCRPARQSVGRLPLELPATIASHAPHPAGDTQSDHLQLLCIKL